MYSVYKLYKWGYYIHPWHTPFPILNQSIVPCQFLIVDSRSAYRYLRRQVKWSGIPISKNFPVFVIHTVKGFSVVNEAEVDVFLEFPCFFYCPMDADNLISSSSAFFKFNLYFWNFSVHILLKLSLKDFEHHRASMWNECNCVVVWTFFGMAFLWCWKENWTFLVLWPLSSFPHLLTYWVQHFNSIIF